MAKSCNGTKSFKQKNPDLNLDEIQNNPHIPDDVKAILNEKAIKLADVIDEENKDCVEEEDEEAELATVDLKTTKDILAYIDDGNYLLLF